MKRTSFLGVSLKGFVGLHRTVQLQLLQRYWFGHRLGLLWYWMVCLGNEQRSFCRLWDCIQVLHFRVFSNESTLCMRWPKYWSFSSSIIPSNLPWFMELTFQVPMQYCSLLHRTLLLSPVTSTARYCFCFGSIPSFFLELFLHWSPVAYWHLLTWGVSLSVSYHFAFSYCPWGSQGKNTEVVCHSLLQWTTFCQISPPWPAYLGLPHGHGLVSLS